MEYHELESWRHRAVLVAVAAFALAWVLDAEWPYYVEALAWLVACGFTIWEARMLAKEGKSAARRWAVAALYLVLVILTLW